MFKFYNKDHKTKSINVVLLSLLLTLNIQTITLYLIYIVDFHKINVGWEVKPVSPEYLMRKTLIEHWFY